jgi:uncharacterized protein YndB with AHSA1/START domain
MISVWNLDASPEQVWSLLAEPADWPRWWPQVRRVEPLAPGDGISAVYRTGWGSRLPYQVTLEARVLQVQRPRLIEVEAQGDVKGRGLWRLDPRGDGTQVRYTWEVKVGRFWMRWLARLLHPVFAWNHHQVMAAGAAGMAKALGTGTPRYQAVSDPPRPLAPANRPANRSQPDGQGQ